MKNSTKSVRKIVSALLAMTMLSGLCVTAGLLTTSAAAAPGEKVVDLSIAGSGNVEISGDLAKSATMAPTDKFEPGSGIYVSGKTQTVQAGTHVLSASFKEDAFGTLGDKVLDRKTWDTSGDGFKFTVLVPSTGTATTVGIDLFYKTEPDEDEPESKEYHFFCEQEVTPGQRQDIKMNYADFMRLSTPQDFAVTDKDGNRFVHRPNPGDTSVENQKYMGLSKYNMHNIKYASIYVKTTVDAETTVTPKFAVSDISTFENQIQQGYITKWNDYKGLIKENDGVVGRGGDIPFEATPTDMFAPNGGIYVWGDRTLHADAVDKNGKNYDTGPKNVQVWWTNFEDMTDYTGLRFQAKVTEDHNIGRYGGMIQISVGLWTKDPATGNLNANYYYFDKFFGIDIIGEVIDIKMPFAAFTSDSEGKMPASEIANVSSLVIFSRTEFYTDTIATSDMYISDLYGYQKVKDPIPTPEKEETTTYPPEADPVEPGEPETTTTGDTTTTATESAATTTTTATTEPTTEPTTAATTTTTEKVTTAPTTAKPTSTATTPSAITTTTATTTEALPDESDTPDVTDSTTLPDSSTPQETNSPVADAPSNDNPNTGAAAPAGLAIMTGAAGMILFFTKKKRK